MDRSKLFSIRSLLCCALFVMVGSALGQGQGVPLVRLTGRVVDQQGLPVKAAPLGVNWRRTVGGNKFVFGPGHKWQDTDENGYFDIEVPVKEFPFVLGAYSLDNMDGAMIVLDKEDVKKPLRIVLKPLQYVGLSSLEIKGGAKFEWPPNILVTRKSDGLFIARYQVDPTGDSIALLPGDYQLTFKSLETTDYAIDITVPEGDDGVSLGAIALPPNKLVQQFGKPAPQLKILDANGVPQNTQISDFKGKWVVIEFWGYWCAPCVQGGIPHLFDLHENHGNNPKLQILALHYSRDVTDFQQLKEKTRPFVEQFWEGRELSFPVLLDNGATAKAWGVQYFPTTLLVDPEGRLLPANADTMRRMMSDLES